MLANGQADPAVKVGFTEFSDAAQDPSLFTFTPPAGATVSEKDVEEEVNGKGAEDWLAKADLKTVGSRLGHRGHRQGARPRRWRAAEGMSGRAARTCSRCSARSARRCTGDFGTGYVISTNVGTALITEDGKVAVGAVPEQVVTEAIATVK